MSRGKSGTILADSGDRRGQRLYELAKTLIPGGTQLLSKRPEMFLPDLWPAYYRKASGIEIEDLDGTRYRDMAYHGIGACVLGYAHPEVDGAVVRAISQGVASLLNCPEEVELAEHLVNDHPWADMARFTRAGGEAMAVAVRIARAATGRDVVAFCGYHGWHDWYLSANLGSSGSHALSGHLLAGLEPQGVPTGLRDTARGFPYNDLAALETICAEAGDRLAAIVMEPLRSQLPEDNFLNGVRSLADRCGAVLIFDEVTSGFRLGPHGAHLSLGTDPDIAVFAKALGNGYPIAAVIGRREIMEAAQQTFVSSTSWTERTGFAAALATLDIYRRDQVEKHLHTVGSQVRTGWLQCAAAAGIEIEVAGIPPLSTFRFVHPQAQIVKTLFVQEMLERGFLATGAFYASLAHTERDCAEYLEAVSAVFRTIGESISAGTLASQLKGEPAHTGFARLA